MCTIIHRINSNKLAYENTSLKVIQVQYNLKNQGIFLISERLECDRHLYYIPNAVILFTNCQIKAWIKKKKS